MKLTKLLLGLTVAATGTLSFTSCTNEMVNPVGNGSGSNPSSLLVHAPDVYAWSGNSSLNGSTRSSFTRAEESPVTFSACESAVYDKAKAIETVEGYLTEEQNNKNLLDTDFLFYAKEDVEFEFYPAVFDTSYSPNFFGLFYYDESGTKHEVDLWNPIDQYNGLTRTDYSQNPNVTYYIGVKVKVKKGYKFGFYWGGSYSYKTEEYKYTTTTYYTSSQYNEEVYMTTGGGSRLDGKETVHAGVFKKDGMTFLCMEDWTDFDYQDLVFSCNSVLDDVSSDNILPGVDQEDFKKGETPTPDDKCPKCDHDNSKHEDGVCSDCEPGGECKPADGGTTPGEGEGDNNGGDNGNDQPGNDQPGDDQEDPTHHYDEVEVNYSINDVHTSEEGQKYENADLWTKLSIHVRKGTDVKITVPIPGKYMCESDDFAILQDHLEGNGIYTGQSSTELTINHTHQMTYNIDGKWNVTLSVEIDEFGMTVSTSGINQELIDYLFEKNGDGINFEVWNYYQTETVEWIDGVKDGKINGTLSQEEYEAFQGYLNQAKIEFTNAPTYYINAFGYEWFDGQHNEKKRPGDCIVTPSDNSFSKYGKYVYHLNGTPWNVIYIHSKADTESSDYKGHTKTPDPAVNVD